MAEIADCNWPHPGPSCPVSPPHPNLLTPSLTHHHQSHLIHSTTAEALSASLQAGAERVVLTHFSQRYPKYPAGVFPDIQATAEAAAAAAAGDDRGDTLTVTAPIAVHGEAQHAPDPIVAFDGLRCSLADLLVLPLASRLLAEALTEVPEAGADVEA